MYGSVFDVLPHFSCVRHRSYLKVIVSFVSIANLLS
nr:MAG TPA: hypothetical protein [Caudoviricetes sp.]